MAGQEPKGAKISSVHMTGEREDKEADMGSEEIEVPPPLMENGGADFGELEDVDVSLDYFFALFFIHLCPLFIQLDYSRNT